MESKTIECVIAVPQRESYHALIIEAPQDVLTLVDSLFCRDLSMDNVPDEPGVYRCTIEHRWYEYDAEYGYDEYYTVLQAEKLQLVSSQR
jgi:hypothetical protein